ncbi:ANTAR domain-containing protein [Streptomyces sp. YC504]|uniref:ANTAR domain-containing protein n=1 Tax=Streptomyces mesophilus TaxID=1775132 RepID=A0A6G4XPX2_9ACTN|nr:ANTAR domain-containing protein [Streptomyces mesophilus]NGO78850.1 ANTAR domain-containing protein [Streptomyces mesophilus]
MNPLVTVREERWALKAEMAWGVPAQAPAVALLRAENDSLRRTLAGRAVIDQARGMVMALTPCTRGEARSLLVDVSRQCDLKLREVAAALVATSDGAQLPRHMQAALRRALRRLHAAQRRRPVTEHRASFPEGQEHDPHS